MCFYVVVGCSCKNSTRKDFLFVGLPYQISRCATNIWSVIYYTRHISEGLTGYLERIWNQVDDVNNVTRVILWENQFRRNNLTGHRTGVNLNYYGYY